MIDAILGFLIGMLLWGVAGLLIYVAGSAWWARRQWRRWRQAHEWAEFVDADFNLAGRAGGVCPSECGQDHAPGIAPRRSNFRSGQPAEPDVAGPGNQSKTK